jgi:hypothetical protein
MMKQERNYLDKEFLYQLHLAPILKAIWLSLKQSIYPKLLHLKIKVLYWYPLSVKQDRFYILLLGHFETDLPLYQLIQYFQVHS